MQCMPSADNGYCLNFTKNDTCPSAGTFSTCYSRHACFSKLELVRVHPHYDSSWHRFIVGGWHGDSSMNDSSSPSPMNDSLSDGVESSSWNSADRSMMKRRRHALKWPYFWGRKRLMRLQLTTGCQMAEDEDDAIWTSRFLLTLPFGCYPGKQFWAAYTIGVLK